MSKVSIDISVDDEGWAEHQSDDDTDLETLASNTVQESIEWAEIAIPAGSEISLVFSSDAAVRALNHEWRGRDKATNVLSFASNDGVPIDQWSPLLGDIVLARETIAREAVEQGKNFHHHLTHLIVHGTLHLLGFDHQEENQAVTMEQLERDILARLNIDDPYGDDASWTLD